MFRREKILVVLVILVSGYLSCNKSILNIPPPVQDEETFFRNEADFRRAIVGTYAALTDLYSSTSAGADGSAQLEIWFLPGDDLSQNGSQSFEFFRGLNPADPKLNQFFKSCYALIGRANRVLRKIDQVDPGVFVTTGLREHNKGEMLFLRAFAHFMLWNVFGTAPVDTIVVESINQVKLPSSKGTALLDQAIADLTLATKLLPRGEWDAANTGRVTSKSAFGLMAKCLLFRGDVSKNQADFEAAAAAADSISDASLLTSFGDNFEIAHENSAESLFEFQAGENIVGEQNAWLANDECDCGVTGAYYQMFYSGAASYMSNGPYLHTQKLHRIFDMSDPRRPFTVNDTGIVKYIVNGDVGNNHVSYNNHRILRYADVLLIRAEAIVKSGGTPGDAIRTINVIRARARNMAPGGTVPANYDESETDRKKIMQWIMDERLRELAGEGHRWFDLRRWHFAGDIKLDNVFFDSEVPARMGFEEHYLYFPIPENETSRNPNIVQNAGY